MSSLHRSFGIRVFAVFGGLLLAACGGDFNRGTPPVLSEDTYLTAPASAPDGTAPPVTMASIATGLYSPQAVTLTCTSGDGADCLTTYYTIDGTTPSQASTVYNGPIALWSKTTLKFFSVDRAGRVEPVRTENFLIGSIALPDVRVMEAGRNHTLAIKGDGTLWTWGGNDAGQLGDGSGSDQPLPVQIGTGHDWATVAAGNAFSLAIKNDGTLWAWGNNSSGQLGTGTVQTSLIPVQVGTDADWLRIAAGADFALALKRDSSLWSWGENGKGQLGDGTAVDSSVPLRVGSGTEWQATAAGYDHAVALRSDGTLWAWGGNRSGQLGQGSLVDSSVPLQVPGANWSAVTAGGSDLSYPDDDNNYYLGGHTVALKSDGTLWAWGQNIFGQLGDGTYFNSGWAGAGTYKLTGAVTFDRVLPTQIGTDTDWATISGGAGHTVALKEDGTLWAWGLNVNGQLANGNPGMNNLLPLPVGPDTHLPYIMTRHPWLTVTAGGYHTLALRSDGTLWAWGWNGSGQLGDGTTFSTGGGSDAVLPTWRLPRYAYVISDRVYPYTIDYRKDSGSGPNSGSGMLTRAGEAVAAGADPFTAVFDPTGRFLYVLDRAVATVAGNKVSHIYVRSVDRATGNMTPVGADGVKTLHSPTALMIDPLGRFLYVVGTHAKGWKAVAVYTINPVTGELTCIGTGAKGATVMTIEPQGRFAYTLRDVGLTGYSIDQRTGMLSGLQTACPYDRCDDDEDDADLALEHPEFYHYLQVDLSGQYLYAARKRGVKTVEVTGEIRPFSINQTSGRIYDTHVPQAEPDVSAMIIAPGVADDSHTQFMYILHNDNLKGLRLNQLTGQVTGVGLESSPGALMAAAEPTGKLIYVCTAKHVLGYAIDPLPPGGKTQVIGPPTRMATDAASGNVTLKSILFASY